MRRIKRNALFLTLFVAVLFMNFYLIANSYEAQPRVVKEIVKQEETVVVLRQPGPLPDLQQQNEGTVVVTLRATDKDINIGEKTPTKVQLFRSSKVDGLVIYYMYGEKTLQAGTPRLITPQIELLDGQMHEIVYTFKKGDRQKLYFDKQKIAESNYDATNFDLVTGYLIRARDTNRISIDSTSDTRFAFYEKQLTEDDVKAME